MNKSTFITPLALFVLLLIPDLLEAQCAMCKAVIESDITVAGAARSQGVNSGILYLMGFPYMLIGGFIAYVFRDRLRQMVVDMF